MIEAGMVFHDKQGWHYDDGEAKLKTFFENARNVMTMELVPVYDERDPEKAKVYIEKNFKPSEVLQQFEKELIPTS